MFTSAINSSELYRCAFGALQKCFSNEPRLIWKKITQISSLKNKIVTLLSFQTLMFFSFFLQRIMKEDVFKDVNATSYAIVHVF